MLNLKLEENIETHQTIIIFQNQDGTIEYNGKKYQNIQEFKEKEVAEDKDELFIFSWKK